MATVFPFNKVSKIPSIILKQVLNILFKQQQLILNLILQMDSFVLSMSNTAKCDDAEVLALKNKIKLIDRRDEYKNHNTQMFNIELNNLLRGYNANRL